MRKIFCYTDSLLEVFYKDFVRDTDKFFRASKLTLEHMKVEFDYKGDKWKIIGLIDAKEMVCRNINNNSVWAIDRQEVQKAIMGDTNVDFTKQRERNLKPLAEEKA